MIYGCLGSIEELRRKTRMGNQMTMPVTTHKIRFGFKGKNQLPLFMIVEEEIENSEVVFARVLFNSFDWIGF